VLSCIDPSVRIMTKSPKDLDVYSQSLWSHLITFFV
jgi:hypothetical protein